MPWNSSSFKIFVLIMAIILVVYYVGSTNLATALTNGVVKVIYTLQGRTSSGQFANYPSGGGSPALGSF